MSEVVPIYHGKVRLSNSTMDIIHTCERKFQKEKLLVNPRSREHTADTVLGTAFGVGIAEYLVSQDMDIALYKTWMAYWPILESEKKSQVRCFNALMQAKPKLDLLLEEYEVVSFNGKKAIELSFCINMEEDYYYVGYIDVVLKHKITGRYVVVDGKTTGLELLNLAPLYKNSAQLIGYSIVLDAIVGEDLAYYDVMYIVSQLGRQFAPITHVLSYSKTLLDRLNWFLALGMDVERLDRMKELGIYPMRGTSCLKYNRPCAFFGECEFHSLDMPKQVEVDTEEYDFHFNLESLITSHIARVDKLK